MLRATSTPLVETYDLVMLDLDGVVYVGDAPVPGAPDHLRRAREAGAHLAFVTNNASRPPAAVAEKLAGLGVEAHEEDVVTSAQAAARVLLERHGAGARVAVLGTHGLLEALRAEGLEPVGVDDEAAVALATGYGPDVVWRDVMRAATRVRQGLPWVASNADLSLPTPFGEAPGHGVMVDLISRFAGVEPVVAGKPERPLLDETVRRVGGSTPLMVGDRLDTDIEGAHRAGVDSLLVLTGVTGLEDLLAADPKHRPAYLSSDLAGLFGSHPAPEEDDGAWSCGGWRVRVTDGRLAASGGGDVDDWWRCVAAAAWSHRDATGRPADSTDLRVPSADGAQGLG
ncbi:HAD-IIA family hydrolase [Nocardioides sp. GCM10027113]|uniref:HAD-IIA family hydrolase n=1 Tax=unclassified Nocardioides TaxID=2615069 RepID=UPI00360BDFA3